ncbi:MAG: winged helix DNA-binding domain-containing protein [Microbacteriaceae bacterium]|nr:winged helix DNA-binding domain-containing protein [Microbacteriaceae bacterium]
MHAARAAAPALPASRRRELAELRIIAQGLVDHGDGATPFATPAEVAAHLGCAQGQHLGGVRSALALRLHPDAAAGDGDGDARSRAVAAAFADGSLVRGYPMRGTLFATAADDLEWMTALTRERQLAGAAKRRAEHGLDDALLERIAEASRAALEAGGGALGRDALIAALAERGIVLEGGQRYHALYTLIVQGVLAYGQVSGGEALVVDAARHLPPGGSLESRFGGDEDAAIAAWLRRYLVGHGPATLRDFHWWTKLPLGRVRRVEPVATRGLEHYGEDALGEALQGPPGLRERRDLLDGGAGVGRLLPPFDEVVLGYPDRDLIVAAEHRTRIVPGGNGVFPPTAHRRGTVVGLWRTAGTGARRRLELEGFDALPAVAVREFERAFADYPHPV